MGTITLLKSAIRRKQRLTEALQDDNNSQSIELYNKALAEIEAFESCLASLRGDHSMLRTYSYEI